MRNLVNSMETSTFCRCRGTASSTQAPGTNVTTNNALCFAEINAEIAESDDGAHAKRPKLAQDEVTA